MTKTESDPSHQVKASIQSDLRTLMEWAQDFLTSRVLTTAVERNLFERFNGGPKSITNAKRSDEDDEAFRRLVRTLASMGLLERDDEDSFEPTQFAKNFLIRPHPKRGQSRTVSSGLVCFGRPCSQYQRIFPA